MTFAEHKLEATQLSCNKQEHLLYQPDDLQNSLNWAWDLGEFKKANNVSALKIFRYGWKIVLNFPKYTQNTEMIYW